jgi:hypothetical protein
MAFCDGHTLHLAVVVDETLGADAATAAADAIMLDKFD